MSGEMGYNQLRHIEGNKLPCAFVLYEDKYVLSIFLNFVIEHPEIPLNRVYYDFLTPLNEFMHLEQYLESENMPYCFESYNYVYEELIKRAAELWESGKIDMLLTRCTNILDRFDELHSQDQEFYEITMYKIFLDFRKSNSLALEQALQKQ